MPKLIPSRWNFCHAVQFVWELLIRIERHFFFIFLFYLFSTHVFCVRWRLFMRVGVVVFLYVRAYAMQKCHRCCCILPCKVVFSQKRRFRSVWCAFFALISSMHSAYWSIWLHFIGSLTDRSAMFMRLADKSDRWLPGGRRYYSSLLLLLVYLTW